MVLAVISQTWGTRARAVTGSSGSVEGKAGTKPDVQQTPAKRLPRFRVACRLILGRPDRRGEEREPETLVGRIGHDVEAFVQRLAAGEERCRVVRPDRAAVGVELRERHFERGRQFVGIGLALVVGRRGHRKHGELVAGFERNRTVQRGRRADWQRGHGLVLPEGNGHHSARRPRRPQRNAEQPEKGEALTLRYQIHAIEQRIAEPGEQLNQRPAGIPRPRIGPLGRVRGDPRDQFGHEVVVRTVIQSWWSEGHGMYE